MGPKPSTLSLVHVLLSQDGFTALMCASQHGHVNVVEKLLAAGANHDVENKVRNY